MWRGKGGQQCIHMKSLEKRLKMESTRAIFQILEYILGVTESINHDLIYW